MATRERCNPHKAIARVSVAIPNVDEACLMRRLRRSDAITSFSGFQKVGAQSRMQHRNRRRYLMITIPTQRAEPSVNQRDRSAIGLTDVTVIGGLIA